MNDEFQHLEESRRMAQWRNGAMAQWRNGEW
jgi:phage terminase large subunit-like protein